MEVLLSISHLGTTCVCNENVHRYGMQGCREIDACEPYVKYANGSVISFRDTCFYEIDSQAVVSGTALSACLLVVVNISFALHLSSPLVPVLSC